MTAIQVGQGTVVVVTGAAHGIGRALADALSDRGCSLALVDKDDEELQRTADSFRRTPCSIHVADVANSDKMLSVSESVMDMHGGIHVLINNAGVSLACPFESGSLEDFRWLMATNFWGVVHSCHVFLPHMRQQHAAQIVHISSLFSLLGFSTKSAYCASKFALRGFEKALALELQGSGVRFTTVYPGAVDTGFIERGRSWNSKMRAAEVRFVRKRAIPMERLVRRIIHGIERRRRRVFVGWEPRAVMWAVRCLPASWISRLAARGFRAMLAEADRA